MLTPLTKVHSKAGWLTTEKPRTSFFFLAVVLSGSHEGYSASSGKSQERTTARLRSSLAMNVTAPTSSAAA